MKKYEIIFGAIKLPLDFLIVIASFFLAKEIRINLESFLGIPLPLQTISSSELWYFSVFGAFLYIIIFAIHGIYFIKITASKIGEILKIIQYSFYWMVFFSFFVYLGNGYIYENEIPRLIIAFSFIISLSGIIIERIILHKLEYFLMNKGIIQRKKLLLVNNKPTQQIEKIITDIEQANIYHIIGYSNNQELDDSKFPYLGNAAAIQALFEKKQCDEVLYIDSNFEKEELLQLWELTRIFGIRYRYVTNSFDVTKGNTSLSLIHTIPVIEINATGLSSWMKLIKRIFDLFAGIFGLIICSPLFLVIAILIKIEDPEGPIIYKNKRIGKAGKTFNLYKFRYMKWKYCVKEAYGVSNDEALVFEKELIKKSSSRSGPLYKIKNDPRKTKIGTFIEKYSIDELPQFFNLILGNMSLVGPRPHQPREVEKYELGYKRLLTIKPGITGMAQVNGREQNDFKKEAELDLFYIENWNVLLDLKIIVKTFGVIFSKK